MAQVSVRKTLVFSFTFLFRNAPRIAARIALPALAGWIAFYVAFYLYLAELERYLGSPSDRIASLVLGLATAGLLVTLFMHSIIVSAIASLALGLEERGWKYFRVGRSAWRIYAANLRFVLICAIFIGVMRLGEIAIGRIVPIVEYVWIANIVMGGGLCWLVIRLWFPIAPIAVAKRNDEILRYGWRLSSGHFWSITAIMAVMVFPGLVFEFAGESLMRLLGESPQLDPSRSLASLVAMYRQILPEALFAIGIGYLVTVVLTTLGRVTFFRQLADQTES